MGLKGSSFQISDCNHLKWHKADKSRSKQSAMIVNSLKDFLHFIRTKYRNVNDEWWAVAMPFESPNIFITFNEVDQKTILYRKYLDMK